MRAISKEPVPYICESDRGLDKKNQTIFHIKPKTYQEVNKAMSRYGGSFTEDQKGFKQYDDSRLNNADQQEWCDVVVKIENFDFGEAYYTEHPEMKAKTNKHGFIAEIEDSPTKIEVLRNLPANIVNEIWRVSQDYTKLKESEKNA